MISIYLEPNKKMYLKKKYIMCAFKESAFRES
jgi:hypothetical protein